MIAFRCSIRKFWHRWGIEGLLGILLLAVPIHAQAQGLSVGESLSSLNVQLERVDGSSVSVRSLLGNQGTVFLFWSNQCAWVDRYEDRLQGHLDEFQTSGLRFVLVNANDARDSPSESLEASRKRAERRGYRAIYVRDPKARLAQALGASRTPHVFVFNGGRTLIYKGAIDDSPSEAVHSENTYLRDAVSALLEGDSPEIEETEPFGCTLKYPGP